MTDPLALLGLGLAAGLGIAVQPGAVSLLVIDQAMLDPRRGAAAAFGVAVVDAGACAIALLASAAVVALLQGLGEWPTLVAGLLLAVVGTVMLRTPPERHAETPGSTRGLLAVTARFIVLTAGNPATVLYFLAFAVGVRAIADDPLSIVAVMAAAGVASLAWQLILVVVGALLGRTLRPGMRRALRILGALVVMMLGISVMLGAVLD
jgi:threonine/homoserine/homoserine lactone efflux protein